MFFKTIGYSCRPTNKNEDGLVGIILNKKEADVRADQKTIATSLHKIFNSDAALSVVIDSIKSAGDDKCEVRELLKLLSLSHMYMISNILGCFLRKSTCVPTNRSNKSNS